MTKITKTSADKYKYVPPFFTFPTKYLAEKMKSCNFAPEMDSYDEFDLS